MNAFPVKVHTSIDSGALLAKLESRFEHPSYSYNESLPASIDSVIKFDIAKVLGSKVVDDTIYKSIDPFVKHQLFSRDMGNHVNSKIRSDSSRPVRYLPYVFNHKMYYGTCVQNLFCLRKESY